MRPSRTALAVLLATACAAPPEKSAAPTDAPPNVVVFFIDDLGYADVEPFGAPAGSTPHVARLAAEGRAFFNFHVAEPVCSASRAALLTGVYPARLGVHGALMPWDKGGLKPEDVTLAETLKARGYATAHFGKWHLGHATPDRLPTSQGFDEHFGIPYSNDMWPPNTRQKFPPLPLYDGERIVDADVDAADQATLTARITERAVRFVEAPRASPFFMVVAHPQPHVPLFAGAAHAGRTGRGLYADVVSELDASVGAVLSALDRTGAAANTLVVFTSDNGPWLPFGEHAGSAGPLREGKGTTWEGGVRVPCVARWPGRIPAGSRSDVMVSTLDLAPTIAALAGAPSLPSRFPYDGRARADVLTAATPAAATAPEAYAYFYGRANLEAVVSGDGRWKLHFPKSYVTLEGRPGGRDGDRVPETRRTVARPELYDLATDVGETKDVADQNPEVVSRLQAFAARLRSEITGVSAPK
jgi:arylsulfatase A